MYQETVNSNTQHIKCIENSPFNQFWMNILREDVLPKNSNRNVGFGTFHTILAIIVCGEENEHTLRRMSQMPQNLRHLLGNSPMEDCNDNRWLLAFSSQFRHAALRRSGPTERMKSDSSKMLAKWLLYHFCRCSTDPFLVGHLLIDAFSNLMLGSDFSKEVYVELSILFFLFCKYPFVKFVTMSQLTKDTDMSHYFRIFAAHEERERELDNQTFAKYIWRKVPNAIQGNHRLLKWILAES